MEEDPQLSLLRFSWIAPAAPTHTKSLFLSAADIICRKVSYNRRVLFYKISSEEYCSVIESLKRSLSVVLVDFYPLAGRLSSGEDGRLVVDCNDMGAEFVEASLAGPSFSDLESDNFQMKPFFTGLTRWESYSFNDVYSAPLLSIQVTKFKCGGLALGVAHSHVLADGHSLWHFMNSWAKCGRGAAISMPPVHVRTLLRVNNPTEKTAYLNLEEIQDVQGHNGVLQNGQDAVQRLFHFSPEMMKRLKENAAPEDGKRGFTSHEVLCAHIWKCVVRARQIRDREKIGFMNVANMRRLLNPPLTDAYFGNALTWGMAVTTAGELEKESLASTAKRMHESISSCNEATMRGMLHWLELHGEGALVDRVKLNGLKMRVSSSPRFPAYDVDFGLGRPMAVRSATVEEVGKIVMYPGREGGGSVDICMALPLDAMERLEGDPTFTLSHIGP